MYDKYTLMNRYSKIIQLYHKLKFIPIHIKQVNHWYTKIGATLGKRLMGLKQRNLYLQTQERMRSNENHIQDAADKSNFLENLDKS